MDIQLLALKIVRRIRKVGLWATLRQAIGSQGVGGLFRRGGAKDAFDAKYGTDTSEPAALWKFKIDSPNARFGAAYQTVSEEALVDALSSLPENTRDLTFIDLGCGKGRALLIAGNLGFKQVIGVEFAQELAEIAESNLKKAKITNASVIAADAAQYQFPKRGELVIYLFNPFSQEVMQTVIANLRESLPRKVYVIYASPQCAALFDSSGFMERLACATGRADIQVWGNRPVLM